MKKIIDEEGNTIIELTKAEFVDNYLVGCLDTYESNGDPESLVRIRIWGRVPDLKHCVFRKGDNGEIVSKSE